MQLMFWSLNWKKLQEIKHQLKEHKTKSLKIQIALIYSSIN